MTQALVGRGRGGCRAGMAIKAIQEPAGQTQRQNLLPREFGGAAECAAEECRAEKWTKFRTAEEQLEHGRAEQGERATSLDIRTDIGVGRGVEQFQNVGRGTRKTC